MNFENGFAGVFELSGNLVSRKVCLGLRNRLWAEVVETNNISVEDGVEIAVLT